MSEPAILTHLENVRVAGPGHWTACCPCHASESKSSLSITYDGAKTLLHDFGPCETEAILQRLSLGWSILFDGDGNEPSVHAAARNGHTAAKPAEAEAMEDVPRCPACGERFCYDFPKARGR